MRHVTRGGGLLLATALGLWGCGGGGGGAATPTSASPPAASGSTVTANIVGAIGSAAYSPNPVAARPGDTVVFRNNDNQLHRIVLDNGSADLGDIAPGATSRGLAIANGNELRFHCTLHASMVGSINGAVAPEPPCVDQYGYAC
jgi:plastocyanin